jgi:hypothetical protein
MILCTGERNSFFIPDYLVRQDKESYDSDASHAEKAFFFFKDRVATTAILRDFSRTRKAS